MGTRLLEEGNGRSDGSRGASFAQSSRRASFSAPTDVEKDDTNDDEPPVRRPKLLRHVTEDRLPTHASPPPLSRADTHSGGISLDMAFGDMSFLKRDGDANLAGPLPPLPAQSMAPPLRRLGSALLEDRRVAREHILKASPVLHFTESWWQTVASGSEYVPPRIYYFVVVASALTTWLALRYPILTTGDNTVHQTQIGFISLLIVFRTSQAYARWWEGRTLWGSIVNSTRNLASNSAAFIADEMRYTRVIICTIAFAYATKQSLRAKKFDKAEMAGLFSDEEIDLMNQVEHIPMLMVDEIRRTIKTELVITKQAPGGLPSDNLDIVLAVDIKALVDALGGCERIAKTPMPFGYLAQLRIFILLWLVSWPLALAKNYEWASIAMVAFVAFIMLKIEEMAVQIEHPFGMGANDLPIDTICVTIERNLLEVLRRAEHLRILAHAECTSAAAMTRRDTDSTPLFRLVPPFQMKPLPPSSSPTPRQVDENGITLQRIRSRARAGLTKLNNDSRDFLTLPSSKPKGAIKLSVERSRTNST
mmetsp:Transcript_42006/g.103582  ORF Transcript_42006/g.103582 Transcript_42006/m.103582 type:complete len:534 (+) Transcript_42006:92-1693(+)